MVHYGWSRALTSLRRSWRAALATGVMLAGALTVLGLVGLLYVNVEHLGRIWLSNTTLSLFLKGDLDDAARNDLLGQVRGSPFVQSAQLVSPKEGLQQL